MGDDWMFGDLFVVADGKWIYLLSSTRFIKIDVIANVCKQLATPYRLNI